MFRALLELIVTILVALVARAILSSVMKGFANSAAAAFQGQASHSQGNPAQQPRPAEPQRSGELHKDPVCGTYVAESTGFRRQSSGRTYYYCSAICRDKHS